MHFAGGGKLTWEAYGTSSLCNLQTELSHSSVIDSWLIKLPFRDPYSVVEMLKFQCVGLASVIVRKQTERKNQDAQDISISTRSIVGNYSADPGGTHAVC